MAKKKKSTKAKAKTTTRAKRVPVKAQVQKQTELVEAQAATVEAPAKKVSQMVQVALPEPQVPVVRRPLSMLERVTLALGGILLLVGIVGVAQQYPGHDTVSDDVKSQTIPMSPDDFNDDPAIQKAIQKQLGGTDNASQTPQQQPVQSPQSGTNSLQAPINTSLQQ